MMRHWFSGTGANLVWNTMVLMTVLLPLSSLVFDVPQYFAAAANLEMALEAAAQEVANDCLQLAEFSQSGIVRLDAGCIDHQARRRFESLTGPLAASGHVPVLTASACKDSCQTVILRGTTALRVFFSLSPTITIARTGSSQVRMTAGAS